MIPKKKKTRIGPDKWAEIKELYIGGRFDSVQKLYEHLAETQPKDQIPTYYNLARVAKAAKWTVDRRLIAQKKEQSTMELFAKNGMPKEEAVKVCIEGMTAGRSMLVELEEKLKAEENLHGAEIISFVQKLNTNMAIVRGFLQEYNKMCGNYAPQQMEVSPIAAQDAANDEAYRRRLEKLGS